MNKRSAPQQWTELVGRLSGSRADVLSPGIVRSVVWVIVVVHAAAAWALMQIPVVRQAVLEAAPMFVTWMAAPEVAPSPAPPAARPAPALKLTVPDRVPAAREDPPVLAPAPEPAPAAEPAPMAQVAVPAAAPAVAAAASSTAPVGPIPLPTSAVAYLVPPVLQYPHRSREFQEEGVVLLTVIVDERGVPRSVQVKKSSGYARLDNAAMEATKRSRFKPLVLDGRPTEGIADIPFEFTLKTGEKS